MKLQDPILRDSGLLVQVVDILSDDAIQFAQPVEFSDGIVSGIWLGFCKKLTFNGHLPKSFASGRAAEELLNGEVLRVISAPDSSRAAKIGYT
jgi:hypothetical protein